MQTSYGARIDWLIFTLMLCSAYILSKRIEFGFYLIAGDANGVYYERKNFYSSIEKQVFHQQTTQSWMTNVVIWTIRLKPQPSKADLEKMKLK